MATYYVDPDAGNDANAGTIASPWQTWQKWIDVVVAGDTVLVANTVAHQPGVTLDFATRALTATLANPIRIGVWDIGSLTATLPGGVIAPAWHLDGESLVANVHNGTLSHSQHFSWSNGYVSGYGRFAFSRRNTIENMQIEAGELGTLSITGLIRNCFFDGCYINITQQYWNILGIETRNSPSIGISFDANANDSTASNSLVINAASHGILCDTSRNVITNCTVVDSGVNGIFNTNKNESVYSRCVITGSGEWGFNDLSSASNLLKVGPNSFWNNTSGNVNQLGTAIGSIETLVETSDPFVNAAGGDYRLKVTSLAATAGSFGQTIGAMAVENSSGGAAGFTGIRGLSRRLGT